MTSATALRSHLEDERGHPVKEAEVRMWLKQLDALCHRICGWMDGQGVSEQHWPKLDSDDDSHAVLTAGGDYWSVTEATEQTLWTYATEAAERAREART